MMYSIKDTTLTAMGDAVRSKVIGTSEIPYLSMEERPIVYKTTIANQLPDYVKKIKVKGFVTHGNSTSTQGFFKLGAAPIYSDNRSTVGKVENGYFIVVDDEITANCDFDFEFTINGNAITFIGHQNNMNCSSIKVSFELIGLDENGNEFKYTPLEMVDKINNLSLIPDTALNITGGCKYKFSNDGWNWFIENGGDKITTADIIDVSYMFSDSKKLTNIPFEINCKSNTNMVMDGMFSSCYKLTELPKVNNVKPSSMSSIISYCQSLREIPEDWCDTWDWSYMDGLTSSYSGPRAYSLTCCYELRKYPNSYLEHGNPVINSSYSIYYTGFQNCYCLDEIIDLPFPHYNASWTSSAFYNFCQSCGRLKNLTFKLQEDGSPYVMKWKSQTIDLSSYIGYVRYETYLKDAGFTTDTKITDDATYQALKDNPDSWTTDINYSRYNHTSAVNTINSLPDCSATGTNTIKFSGASGALTDGGAINTLTEEEIAVAAAKGWTVSLV